MNREGIGMRQVRMINTDFTTREDGDELTIEGYFAVFNSVYQITSSLSESIAPGAFTEALGGDVRALVNHDTTLVLGRNTANTLELREDSHGLWGRVRINPNDSAAVDSYERIKRGDVDGCSIGFDIAEEETEYRDDGSIHWTIKKVNPLYEVSVCTFPAYEQTNVQAREEQVATLKKREREAWQAQMKERLKHGTQSTNEA